MRNWAFYFEQTMLKMPTRCYDHEKWTTEDVLRLAFPERKTRTNWDIHTEVGFCSIDVSADGSKGYAIKPRTIPKLDPKRCYAFIMDIHRKTMRKGDMHYGGIHSNLVVIDPVRKVCSRFDPYYGPMGDLKDMQKALDRFVKDTFCPKSFHFMTVDTKSVPYGPQLIDATFEDPKCTDEHFCIPWVVLVARQMTKSSRPGITEAVLAMLQDLGLPVPLTEDRAIKTSKSYKLAIRKSIDL